MEWQTTRHRIDLAQTRVMAIVNLTPDSFSDGGGLPDAGTALAHCEALLAAGADILDLGAESSRPGAQPVPLDVELARLMPVLSGALTLGCPVSVDTAKPEVMRRVLGLGADIVNDVHALRTEGALAALLEHAGSGVCLMHMHGEPASMQQHPLAAGDVVMQVAQFLRDRVGAVCRAGVAAERIVVDPGIGFGKGMAANLALLRQQGDLLAIGRPLLVGWSRKATLGTLTGRAVGESQSASVAAALAAAVAGASIVRVHDVAATVDALKVWRAAGLLA
ncbi:MAG: dihydropteroate synthase [Burkholderiaceae bacterium]